MTFGKAKHAIVPMRSEGSDRSEMVNQLLFGEPVEIIDEQPKWMEVKSIVDNYQGWVDPKMITKMDESPISTSYLRSSEALTKLKDNDQTMFVPMGSFIDPSSPINIESPERKIDDLLADFKNAPYLWGGKTILGVDCSGLVQVIFAVLGVQLQRDAAQQAEEGALINFIEETKTGDLAFFDNEEGKITHVGIIQRTENSIGIVHASGCVRTDQLDHQGIFHAELEKYTHKLRLLKRIDWK